MNNGDINYRKQEVRPKGKKAKIAKGLMKALKKLKNRAGVEAAGEKTERGREGDSEGQNSTSWRVIVLSPCAQEGVVSSLMGRE